MLGPTVPEHLATLSAHAAPYSQCYAAQCAAAAATAIVVMVLSAAFVVNGSAPPPPSVYSAPCSSPPPCSLLPVPSSSRRCSRLCLHTRRRSAGVVVLLPAVVVLPAASDLPSWTLPVVPVVDMPPTEMFVAVREKTRRRVGDGRSLAETMGNGGWGRRTSTPSPTVSWVAGMRRPSPRHPSPRRLVITAMAAVVDAAATSHVCS
ncbi:hypothetical protein BJ912DRAFT_1010577 [Pholiota molesta]|nr:hypothetical protein BJ912DRAFT_1010577 [Pholiota molesta]